MEEMVNQHLSRKLLAYISEGQKDLMMQGFHLLDHVKNSKNKDDLHFDDFSFIVFPFAKAYEGFLKQVFFDAGYISQADYVSDHFRIGKAISPTLVRKIGNRSVYKKICDDVGCDLSDKIWNTWKFSRNQVFHYFPHNLRSLTLEDAEGSINHIILNMEQVVEQVSMSKMKNKLSKLAQG